MEGYVGGYDYSFVAAPDDLVCQVCHCVARNPHQVDCCGKVYCFVCIERLRRKRAHSYNENSLIKCPNCRANAHPFRDQRSERHIKLLKVSCENETDGCKWAGELGQYDIHKAECEFHVVSCPNVCGAKIKHGEVKKHMSRECPKRKRKCRLCKRLVIQVEMDNHQKTECPKIKVICPNGCGSRKMLREKLLHHRSLCKKEIVPCLYAEAGCTVKVTREELQNHLDEAKDEHLTLASKTIAELHGKITVYKLTPLPVTVKVPNFSGLKQKNEKWVSPVFCINLTQNPEYPWQQCKLYLEVYPNGTDTSQGTHVSVVLKAEIEEACIYFNKTLQVSLLCQTSEFRHVSKRIHINRYVCDSPMYCCDFISHEDLQRQSLARKYLKNNCAYFRVSEHSDHYVQRPWLQCTFASSGDDDDGRSVVSWSDSSSSFSSDSDSFVDHDLSSIIFSDEEFY